MPTRLKPRVIFGLTNLLGLGLVVGGVGLILGTGSALAAAGAGVIALNFAEAYLLGRR